MWVHKLFIMEISLPIPTFDHLYRHLQTLHPPYEVSSPVPGKMTFAPPLNREIGRGRNKQRVVLSYPKKQTKMLRLGPSSTAAPFPSPNKRRSVRGPVAQ